MSRMGMRMLAAAAFVTLAGAGAFGQQGQTVRVRGTIERVDGNTLLVKTRDGSEATVKLAPPATVRGIAKASLSDVTAGSYIGSAAMPQPDGTQKALEIHIFPESMRGTGDGHRPFDLKPDSTMTNGNVDETVANVEGRVLTVKYQGGEKKIVVGPDTPVVKYVPADSSALQPGAKIIITAATKQPDGTLSTGQINVGLNGVTPPM